MAHSSERSCQKLLQSTAPPSGKGKKHKRLIAPPLGPHVHIKTKNQHKADLIGLWNKRDLRLFSSLSTMPLSKGTYTRTIQCFNAGVCFQCLPSFWPVALFTPKVEKQTQPPCVFYRYCWEFPRLFLLLAPVLLQSDREAGSRWEQHRPWISFPSIYSTSIKGTCWLGVRWEELHSNPFHILTNITEIGER